MRRSPADDTAHVDGAGTVVGDVVDGYAIVHRIRVHGCAAIYKAVNGGAEVALKTLCRGAASRLQSRMDNELESLRLLAGCRYTPRLLSTGSFGPQRYLAMSWLPGRSLRRVVEGVGSFAAVAVPVCEVYDELHRRGVVHGDVSRHNIRIGYDGAPGLVDFESSHRPSRGGPRPLGRRFTWAYVAPELAVGAADPRPPTPASDQFTVAAVLYRQLTGRHPRPWVDGAEPDSPRALEVPPRPLPARVARRRPGLPGVFATALSRDPGDRYRNMAEFAASLDEALDG